jgi:hypothetical protein
MLKPYGSYSQALKAPDVLTYVKDLRVNYPADVAEDLLRTLQADAKPAAAAVPATAPVVDLGGGRAAPPAPNAENALFFDEKRPEPDLSPTMPPGTTRGRAPVNPVLPQTIPLQAPSPAPPRAEPVRPLRPLPAPLPLEPTSFPQRPAAEPAAHGSWFAALLFVIVLACGAGLAAFAFLRPYLPPGWLP